MTHKQPPGDAPTTPREMALAIILVLAALLVLFGDAALNFQEWLYEQSLH